MSTEVKVDAHPSYVIFGSENSLDCDVMVFVDSKTNQAESAKKCLELKQSLKQYIKTEKELNVNIAILKDGQIVWAYKGTPDECNNSILDTAKLHPENKEIFITKRVSRSLEIKLIRALRIILSMITRTDRREDVKRALKNNSVGSRLTILKTVKFQELRYLETAKKDSIIDKGITVSMILKKDEKEELSKETTKEIQENYKTIAFQLGQTLALTENIELYTKTQVCEMFPDLAVFLKREKFNKQDLESLTERLDELTGYLDDYIEDDENGFGLRQEILG